MRCCWLAALHVSVHQALPSGRADLEVDCMEMPSRSYTLRHEQTVMAIAAGGVNSNITRLQHLHMAHTAVQQRRRFRRGAGQSAWQS
jgi:hypothetical protein